VTGAPLKAAPTVALCETCRVAGGAVPLWPWHRARMAAGGCGDVMLAHADELVAQAAAEWASAPTHRARLALRAGADGTVTVDVAQQLSSLDVPHGLVAVRVDVSAPPQLPPGPAKPADRTFYDAAHRAARGLGGHEAVLVGPDEQVIDGSTATVWIVVEGALVTPPAPPAIPGVARAFVLATAKHAGMHVRIEALSWERFESADEAFFTNAFGGTAPVRGRGGPGCARVADMFSAIWNPTHR
jgi:branched-subunit amino acid aminotransferase/4-amino-4-deoxychorismate lyase